jgi:hypothetical protein
LDLLPVFISFWITFFSVETIINPDGGRFKDKRNKNARFCCYIAKTSRDSSLREKSHGRTSRAPESGGALGEVAAA